MIRAFGAEPMRVQALHASPVHGFSKQTVDRVTLAEGVGVLGDAHAGATVQHRSRVARDPSAPNLRQVHLMHAELFDELAVAGFRVVPGALGENITTRGIDLLALPRGTRLLFGAQAEIELTGQRNPCQQIHAFQPGLMAAVLGRDEHGCLVRKAGVMAIVTRGGEVATGDTITVVCPAEPHHPLEPV